MEYKLFKLLVDDILQPIWIKDLNLRFIYVNKEYQNMYEGTSKDFIGLKDEEVFNGAVNNELRGYYNLVIDSLKPLTEEICLDGKCRKVTILPLIDENEKIVAIAGIYTSLDIINEKDKIIEEKENVLKVVMETLPGMVFYKDKDGKYVYTNKEFDKFYNGKGIDEFVGKTNFDIHHSEELAIKYTKEDNEVIKTKQSIKTETVLQSDDGKDIYTLNCKSNCNPSDFRLTYNS